MTSDTLPKEKWFVKYWRPAAAWVYLGICVFDFVVMPAYHLQSQGTLDRIVEVSMQLRQEDRLNAIVQLSRKTTWEPITLVSNGMIHLSFGAILGVAAWTRGRVQQEMVRNHDYDPPFTRDSFSRTDPPNSAPVRPPRRSTSGVDTDVY
jgi:hypothetical protein